MIFDSNNKSLFNLLLIRVVGHNKTFTMEHQLLNFTIFFFGCAYLVSLPQNIFANLPLELNISNSTTIVLLAILFAASRTRVMGFELVLTFYFSIFSISLSSAWFFNGGLLRASLITYC